MGQEVCLGKGGGDRGQKRKKGCAKKRRVAELGGSIQRREALVGILQERQFSEGVGAIQWIAALCTSKSSALLPFPTFGGVPTTPEPNTSVQKHHDANASRIVIQIGVCTGEAYFCKSTAIEMGGVIVIHFKGIGVRVRFDSPDRQSSPDPKRVIRRKLIFP